MSSSSPWDAYSQHTGLPSSLESYAHQFSSDMRSLATGPAAAAGMGGFPGESVLGYPKSSDLSAAANLNLTSPYASAYGQSTYPGVPDLGFSGSSLRGSSSHSPGAVATSENLTASSPHGQFSATPTSETHSSPSSFSNPSSSLYSSSTSMAANSIPSSPYAQAFGGAGAPDSTSRTAPPFSPFSQSYGYPAAAAMYGYNQMGGFPSSHPNSLEGMNRYMAAGGISSSQLMPSSAMGLYTSSQASQMSPFSYHPSMAGWGHGSIPGFPLNKETDLMSAEDLERYRYRQLSNPYFHGLPPGGGGRNFPPHALQAGMMRSASFLDDRGHSPTPKKPKKATEEVERAPTPAPKDPACFHSHRGIYLFSSNAEMGTAQYYADSYVLSEKELCEKLSRVSLPGKIQYVYNPLEYAFDSHLKFVRRFCTSEKYILFVGMNPGPFGMSQNGVPFGECAIVKEWLQVEGEVLKPVLEHPKRRVVGLECSRSEVTGGRFWQLFRTLCHTPEQFFRTSYVHNLCPFAFLTDSGKNVTPPQLTSSVLDQINGLCNATLVEVVRLLKCKYVVCIGKYALAQAQKALSADEFSGLTLECLMHPSPINPAANKGWADIAIKQLTDIGIIDIIRYGRIPYQAPQNHPPPHGSSSSHHPQQQPHSQPHHNTPYHSNKQSPGHYGFQSPPVQSYHHHHSPAAASHGGANNHASPSHAAAAAGGGPPNQSPSHARSSQPSPAHHLPPQRNPSQSSPSHSSHGHSPSIQQQQQQGSQSSSSSSVNQSPNHNTTTTPNTTGSHDPNKDSQQGPQGLNADLATSQDGSSQNGTDDKSQDNKSGGNSNGQHNTNNNSAYGNDPSSHENGGPNSQSEPGSQGSEVSASNNSPSLQYGGGKPPDGVINAHGQQMSSGNPMNPASNSGMHPMTMAPGSHPPPPHMAMGQISSPALQQQPGVSAGQDQMGSIPGQQQQQAQMGGSPQLTAQQQQNSHMNSINSHLGPHMNIPPSQQGSHLSGMAGMGPAGMNPYGPSPADQMNQMASYAPGMPQINSYSNSSPAGMTSYGSHMGMPNPATAGSMGVPPGMGGGMHSAGMPGSQMGGGGMFNPHMGGGGGGSMGMGGPPEHHMGMHAGMGSMYGGMDAQQMANHYADKPPDCS